MENLVVRSKEELASVVQSILEGVSSGLRNTRDGGKIVRNPDGIQIDGVFLIDANVDTMETTQTTPATTVESTEETTEIIVTRQTEEPQVKVTETMTPPGRTDETKQGGSDYSKTTKDYDEF